MTTRGWTILGVLTLLGVAGVVFLLSGRESSSPARTDAPPPRLERRASHGGGLGEGTEGSAPIPARAAGSGATAGPGQVPGQVAEGTLGPGEREIEGPARAADETESAGWRLGRARRRIELLEDRLARTEAIRARLESEGRADVAARQQRVLDRTRARLEETRDGLSGLEAEARREGSLADVERGYGEGERGGGAEAPARGAPVERARSAEEDESAR